VFLEVEEKVRMYMYVCACIYACLQDTMCSVHTVVCTNVHRYVQAGTVRVLMYPVCYMGYNLYDIYSSGQKKVPVSFAFRFR